MKKNLVVLFVAMFALTSCTQRLVDFTIISTKNVDLSKGASFERGKARVEGSDKAYIIIFIPTGIPNMKEAIDRAIESVPGCVALLDGVLYSKFFYFIVGETKYVVEGTPLIDPSLTSNYEDGPIYRVVKLDKNGGVSHIEDISADEYLALKNKTIKGNNKVKFENSTTLR
ncbi:MULTISPECIES: hypothetical protein [unclassified Saccharicrinis]|uniref:hypothetical protein n=1 Tax=unclassified Saccharicrinis TaxID=2646859 RepID=UPI003D345F0E